MARIEVFGGAERYRRRSDEEKLAILKEAMEPNAVVSQVARRHDLRPQQIYNWRNKFKAADIARFVEVSVAATIPDFRPGSQADDEVCGSDLVEIGLRCGRSLRVRCGINLQNLSSLITCVEGA